MNKTEFLNLNIGPQHPSTHGVLRLNVTLDGEYVKDVTPVIGYLHRGMEKLAESRTYAQYLPMVDRVDYLSGFFYSALMCYATEQAAGIEVPRYAEYLRLITMELNRIASHLLWLGTFLLDLGATSPLFYCFREREEILKLFENLSGQRMMYNYYFFGGVRTDVPDGWFDDVRTLCQKLPFMFDEYEKIITSNPIFLDRTKGVGILSEQKAVDFAITGVNLRSCGVRYDVRVDNPYSLYDEIDFEIPVDNGGDCYARYLLRVKEMHESCKIVLCALNQILEQEHILYHKKINPLTLRVPETEVSFCVEAPRGLAMIYLKSDGSDRPFRIKWRTPSFNSVQLMPELMRGALYSDLIAILGSLDIVLPEVDR